MKYPYFIYQFYWKVSLKCSFDNKSAFLAPNEKAYWNIHSKAVQTFVNFIPIDLAAVGLLNFATRGAWKFDYFPQIRNIWHLVL